MTQNEAFKSLRIKINSYCLILQIINITLLLIIQTLIKTMKYRYYLTSLVLLSLLFLSRCQQEVAQNEEPQPQTQSNQIQEKDLPKSQNVQPAQNIDDNDKVEDTENIQNKQVGVVEEIKQQQKKDQQYQQIYFPQAIQLIDQTQNKDLVNQNQEKNEDIGDSFITFTQNLETDDSQPVQDQFTQFNTQNFQPTPRSFRRQPPRNAPLSEMRNYFVYLTNILRNKYNAGNVTLSPFLSKIAQDHSQDMVRRDFFDHTNPDGQSVGDRANRNNYFGRIGENLALAYSLNQCQNGFINSPGHFKNAINKIWDEIGVGIAFNRRNAYLVTVLFTPRDISRSKLDANQISYYQRKLSQMVLSQNPILRRQDKKLSQLIKIWLDGNRRTKVLDFVMKKAGFMRSMMVLMFETDFSRDFVKQIQKTRYFVLKNRGFTGFGLGLTQKQNRMEIYVLYYM